MFKIKWHKSELTPSGPDWYGDLLGSKNLFHITWTEGEKPYALRALLPGCFGKVWRSNDAETLKNLATRLVLKMGRDLGFSVEGTN